MNASLLVTVILLGLPAAHAAGDIDEPAAAARFSRALRARYDAIRQDLLDAADQVPESEYAFRPTPDVRSFGEIVGHLADAHRYFCGVANGANPPYDTSIERTRKTKGDLVRALRESMAACDAVYAALTGGSALELVPMGSGNVLRSVALVDNIAHANEHYGNLVTYMRLKGRVPPSTRRGILGAGGAGGDRSRATRAPVAASILSI